MRCSFANFVAAAQIGGVRPEADCGPSRLPGIRDDVGSVGTRRFVIGPTGRDSIVHESRRRQ
ncbi:hypothetical protein OEM_19130 [Mycobacterium intracellulare subsp. yongonense 05-1390]|nr:hypothetical protein OEM_19130 [Mycobacterium intracellulare subsp. yongonense 05-1390]